MTLTLSRACLMLLTALLALALAACSDYPGKGRFEIDTSDLPPGARVISVEYVGEVMELAPTVLERMDEVAADMRELRRMADAPDYQASLRLHGNVHESVLLGIEAHRQARLARLALIEQVIKQTRAEASAERAAVAARVDEIDASLERFGRFTAEAEAAVRDAERQLETMETKRSALFAEAIEAINEVIKRDRLPVRLLDPTLNRIRFDTSSVRYPGSGDLSHVECAAPPRGRSNFLQHSAKTHLVIDRLAQSRTCTYIQPPVSGVRAPDLDAELVRIYFALEDLDANGLQARLKRAQHALADARIVAENQTGVRFATVQREREQAARELASRTREVESLPTTEALALALGDRPLGSEVERQRPDWSLTSAPVYRQAAEMLVANFGEQWKNGEGQLRELLERHQSTLWDQAVEDTLIARVEVRRDGSFDGLEGRYGVFAWLLQIDIDVEDGGHRAKVQVISPHAMIHDREHPLPVEGGRLIVRLGDDKVRVNTLGVVIDPNQWLPPAVARLHQGLSGS